jgi:hypothetical protein
MHYTEEINVQALIQPGQNWKAFEIDLPLCKMPFNC